MTRTQLEHILRAAGAIAGVNELIVVGSQSILGQHPNAPSELLISMEADLFTLRNRSDAELIDGSIGEESPFHRTFGYFAHGVGVEAATLPGEWRQRLVPVNAPSVSGMTVVGLCLEPHDLAVSKLAAGREKDLAFVGTMLKHGLVRAHELRTRIQAIPDASVHDRILVRLKKLA